MWKCCAGLKNKFLISKTLTANLQYKVVLLYRGLRFAVMEPPKLGSGTAVPRPPAGDKRKIPSPEELISHYESKGLDSRQSAIKAIEDLQGVVFRLIASNRKEKLDPQVSRKVESLHSRLAVLDMKLDSKPGYGGAFGVGLASGVALQGMQSVLPHFLRAMGEIWSSVGSIGKQSS